MLPDLGRSGFPKDAAQFGGSVHVRMYVQQCVFIEGIPVEFQTSNKLERHLLQNDCPVASEIAQQYSSAAFISLRFLSHQEKIGRTLQKANVLFPF